MMNVVLASGVLVMSGMMARHNAFDSMSNLPNRPPGYFYATVDDCSWLGAHGILLVGIKQYKVVIGDCAQAKDRAYRSARRLITDVEDALWYRERWPDYPISATLFVFPDGIPDEAAPRVSGEQL